MTNPVTELRRMVPRRALPPWEARILCERQATRLLARQGVSEPAVPEQAIELLPRVHVEYVSGKRLAGATHWDGKRWVVLVNRDDPWGRQRFSMAHEAKHIIDHPDRATLYGNPRYGSVYLQSERAADYFAGCLLMPKIWIKRAFYDEGIRDPYPLARRFQVSTAAMRYRLDQLGLIEPLEVAA
jgi:hypothetical protein